MGVSEFWDQDHGDDLEPDRDPFTRQFVPCVVCGMSPQVGGTGCCSRECEAELFEVYPEPEDVVAEERRAKAKEDLHDAVQDFMDGV